MARGKGNAENWGIGDMQDNEAAMNAASDPSSNARVEVHRVYEENPDKADKLLDIAARACKNAGRGGRARKEKSGRGYVIIVTEPKKKR